jgi:hypothetical protein
MNGVGGDRPERPLSLVAPHGIPVTQVFTRQDLVGRGAYGGP